MTMMSDILSFLMMTELFFVKLKIYHFISTQKKKIKTYLHHYKTYERNTNNKRALRFTRKI